MYVPRHSFWTWKLFCQRKQSCLGRVSAFSLVLGPSLKHLEVAGGACADSSACTSQVLMDLVVAFQDIAVPIALCSAQLLQLACACTSTVQPSLKLLLGWLSTSTLDCEHECLQGLKDMVSPAVSAVDYCKRGH